MGVFLRSLSRSPTRPENIPSSSACSLTSVASEPCEVTEQYSQQQGSTSHGHSTFARYPSVTSSSTTLSESIPPPIPTLLLSVSEPQLRPENASSPSTLPLTSVASKPYETIEKHPQQQGPAGRSHPKPVNHRSAASSITPVEIITPPIPTLSLSVSEPSTRPNNASSSTFSLTAVAPEPCQTTEQYPQQQGSTGRGRPMLASYCSATSSTTLVGSISSLAFTSSLPVPEPKYPASIWAKALQDLSDEDRQALSSGGFSNKLDNKLDVLNHVVEAAKIKRDLCISKQWKITYKGKKIVLREVADKLLAWVEKFKQIGDIVAQYDPVHASLPWAGFRFLLQVGDPAIRG